MTLSFRRKGGRERTGRIRPRKWQDAGEIARRAWAVGGDVDEQRDLNTYMREVRALCDAKGFSSDPDRFWQMLALIHTEISEATDAYKKGQPFDIVGEELIDAVIRILHMLSAMGVDAEALYQGKMSKNWTRPYRYNTVRAQ